MAEGFVALLIGVGGLVAHLLLDRRALVSDTDHQPSRTRVPMPVAALSDPHMGDAAKNPDRVEKIIGGIFSCAIVFFALFGAGLLAELEARGSSAAPSGSASSPWASA